MSGMGRRTGGDAWYAPTGTPSNYIPKTVDSLGTILWVPVPSGGGVTLPARPGSLPVTANLEFHHRPDDGITMDSDNRVSDWADPDIAGKNVSQSTLLNKPTWDPQALNGQPGVRFKRNQYLNRTTSAAIAATDNYTIFIVLRPDFERGVYGCVAFSNGSSANGVAILNGQESDAATQDRIVTIVSSVAWQPTNFYFKHHAPTILCVERASGTTTIYREDGALTPTYATTPNMPTQHWVGWDGFGTRTFDGVIGDMIGYSAALNSTDRASVMNYLGNYYMIPVAY